ncbi:MAG: SDR family NAD(P)-dependent oxidoreductase [Nakamurella sp.]
MRLPGWLASALDTVMDRTVLIGYSRLGYLARRAQWDPADPASGALRGATALVTGANSGLGKAATAGLAELGARVIMVVRNMEKGQQAASDIRAANPDADLQLESCDVSSLESVRGLAARLRDDGRALHVLVHNAGALPAERAETPDGHEMTLATHVLGPLLLTELLRPQLRAGSLGGKPGARVIVISSGGMYTQRLPARDPECRIGEYKGAAAYARTKRLQVAFTPMLAKRLAGDDISVYSMHPGWANTPGIVASLPGFSRLLRPVLRTAEQGADTAVWLAATDPAPESGLFWHDRRSRPDQLLPWTRYSPAELDRVWRYCLDAAGVDQRMTSSISRLLDDDQSGVSVVPNNRKKAPEATSVRETDPNTEEEPLQ